jgi:hypothetical protein
MKTKDRMASVEPVRLGPESTFKFKCHPGVACFTECCRDINIILTPYDIIRLKNRLDLSSEEFLALYTRIPRAKRAPLSEKMAVSFMTIDRLPAAIIPSGWPL